MSVRSPRPIRRPLLRCVVVLGLVVSVLAPAGVADAARAPADLIAYTVLGPTPAYTIHTVNVNTREHHFLISGLSPAWSPDGRRLAFIIQDTNEIVIRNANGSLTHTGVAQLPQNMSAIADMKWSPDGRHLVYVGTDDFNNRPGIWLMNTRAPYDAHLFEAFGLDPWFSPDGKRLMFTDVDHLPINIHIRDLDGTHDRQITHATVGDISLGSWSPNGKKIVYFQNAIGEPGMPQVSGMWVANADGSRPHLLIESNTGLHNSWAPNSSRIAMVMCCVGPQHLRPAIVTIKPDGTGQRVLLSHSGVGGTPQFVEVAWRP